MDGLLSDTQFKPSLFSPVRCRIGEIGDIGKVTKEAVVRRLKFVVGFGEINMSEKDAARVSLTFVFVRLFNFPLLLGVVPGSLGFTNQAHAPAADALAKYIIGADLDVCILSRNVISTIRMRLDRKVGQIVSADAHSGVALTGIVA